MVSVRNKAYLTSMNTELKQYIENKVRPNALKIDVFRKKVLQSIADYIVKQYQNKKQANILFICTHNSRRSHLSQVWAQTAAYYFNLKEINCFSGGTEVTAFYPAAINALQSVGFEISKEQNTPNNPKYTLVFDSRENSITAFSKLYDDSKHNPTKDFCAVMTCSSAEQNCPLVFGADMRFAVHYQDPKLSDNTTLQAKTYTKRSLQIATEMFFIMAQVAKRI